jgi:two-component system sensor histidine kinase GlrK
MRADPSRYPRSFSALLLAGFLVVGLPLAAALLWSAWNTERLAERGTRSVGGALKASRASRGLVSHAGSIERLARQIAVRPEPELLGDFELVHSNFVVVATELSGLPLEPKQVAALDRIVEQERELHKAVSESPQNPIEPGATVARAGRIVDGAYEILVISHLVADREIERLRESAEESRLFLFALIMVAGAAALAFAIVLARIIARPIAQLDDAIRRLGRAEFERPIEVTGPRDLASLGERLDWLRRRLTELEAEKNRFLQHLSHDLKTPLTALREGTELLSDQVAGPLAPSQRQVVASCAKTRSSCRHDRGPARLSAHAALGATLDAERISLEPLLRSSVQAHRLAAAAKGQRLVVEVAPATVWADATKLRSIVDNLLGNAIKFTPSGGVVTLLAQERGGEVEIDVIDTGPGVPVGRARRDLRCILSRPRRCSGRAEGTGLGLAIARDFVKAHGGRIEVVPGSTGGHFRVMLPTRPASELAAGWHETCDRRPCSLRDRMRFDQAWR